jgi:uncharacterized protein YdaU (DUF1376 family)
MAGELPWFPIYAQETLSDERFQSWTCEEKGAWFHLLLMCWREGSIPSSTEATRRMLHLDGADMQRVWAAIGDRFIPGEGADRLVSRRMESERDRAQEVRKKLAAAGAKGGKAPRNRHDTEGSHTQATLKRGSSAREASLSEPQPQPQPQTAAALKQPEDPLGPFRRLLADELAILGDNPLRVARPERAAAFRIHVTRLGLESAVELCADHARVCGTVPKTLDWFLDFLAEQPDPRPSRAAGENPKLGDPDFNDPAAWLDQQAFLDRTDGKTWEEATGLKRPVYRPPLTPEEKAELAKKGGQS